MAIHVEVKGLRELGERLAKLETDMARKIAFSATGAAAKLVRRAAMRNIENSPSIVTRSLLNSIIVKKVPSIQSGLTAAHYVTPRRGRTTKTKKGGKAAKTQQPIAPHAGFVEFGTVKMPAEPFLGPALRDNVRPALDAMKTAIEKGLKRAERK